VVSAVLGLRVILCVKVCHHILVQLESVVVGILRPRTFALLLVGCPLLPVLLELNHGFRDLLLLLLSKHIIVHRLLDQIVLRFKFLLLNLLLFDYAVHNLLLCPLGRQLFRVHFGLLLLFKNHEPSLTLYIIIIKFIRVIVQNLRWLFAWFFIYSGFRL